MADRPAETAAAQGAAPAAEPGSTGVGVLVVLAVLLFAMMLRGEHGLITASGGLPQVTAIQVATYLSSVLLAALVLGGVGGTVAVRALAGRDGARLADRPKLRTVLAVAGGLLLGLLGGGAVLLLESDLAGRISGTIAISVVAAGLLGGALAALRPGVMIAAGLAGCLTVMVVLGLRSLFITQLTRLFGGEGTVAAYANAQDRIALVGAVVAGLAAGVTGHLYLRRAGRRPLGMPGNLMAGALPGLLSLVAQFATWGAASYLVSVAGGLDLGDRLALNLSNSYQINGALALLFAGAVTALILYGRTKGSRKPRPARKRGNAAPGPKPAWAVKEERLAAELDQRKAEQEKGEQTGKQDATDPEAGKAK